MLAARMHITWSKCGTLKTRPACSPTTPRASCCPTTPPHSCATTPRWSISSTEHGTLLCWSESISGARARWNSFKRPMKNPWSERCTTTSLSVSSRPARPRPLWCGISRRAIRLSSIETRMPWCRMEKASKSRSRAWLLTQINDAWSHVAR